MELRQPPRPPARPRRDPVVRALLAAQLLLLAGLAGWWLLAAGPRRSGSVDPERLREVASKLQANGAVEEAALLYAAYLDSADAPPRVRAGIAHSLGVTYLESGRYERALRWLYEAESWDDGELADELDPKIVHALERLGRHHSAQAVLERRAALAENEAQHPASDPVVARIGTREVRRSDVERALDELPPEVARQLAAPAQRAELLRRYVADELLWRKAQKLEYDDDPEVVRRHAALLKQLAVSRFVEREVMSGIEVDPADLANFFAAHRERYRLPAGGGGEPRVPELKEVRAQVERDYRLTKMQAAYEGLIESELAAAEVELFPERLGDAP